MKMILSALPKTWILDLDGTFVLHNGYKLYGRDVWLDGAKEFLHSLPQEDMIVFLTSRTTAYSQLTERFLEEEGIRYTKILYGVPYGERILFNDRKPSGLDMAYAVSGKRDEKLEIEIVIDETL